MAKSAPRGFGLWVLLLAGGSPLLVSGSALAGEVTGAAGALGLGTAVNGVVGGSCGAGLCQVSGGTAAGSNLFHRFSAFDTRGAISGVNVNTGGIPNVFMAVLNPAGTFIDKSVNFSGPTNLVWLSPGGISVSGAGGFANVQQLNLSTATGWKVGSGVFDAAGTTAGQAALLSGTPVQGLAGAVNDPAALTALGLQKNGDLTLAGGLLTVEKELLLDAQGGNVLLQAVGIESRAGSIEVSGAGGIRLNQGATLNTTTGKIALTAADGGVEIQQATISSSSGPIELSGIRSASLPGGTGLTINNSIISSGSGSIDLRGTGGGVASVTEGIDIFGGSRVFTDDGNISLFGIGGDSAQAADFATADGIDLDASEVSSGRGNIILEGQGGSAISEGIDGFVEARGIEISGGILRSTNGSIALNGRGGTGNGSTNADADGIAIFGSSTISTETGGINLFGRGGEFAESFDFASAKGIDVDGSEISSITGSMVLDGAGGNAVVTAASGNALAFGIGIDQGVVSTGTGSIALIGQGGEASAAEVDSAAIADGIQLFSTSFFSEVDINLDGRGGTAQSGVFATAEGIYVEDGSVGSNVGLIVLNGVGGSAVSTGVSGLSKASGIEFAGGVVTNALGALDVSGTGGVASAIGGDASDARAEAVGVQLFFPVTSLSIGGAINLVGGGGFAEASEFASADGISDAGSDIRSSSGSIALDGTGGSAIANLAGAPGLNLFGTTIISEIADEDQSISLIGEAGFEETGGLFLESTAVSTSGLRITGELAPVLINASGGSVVFGGEIDTTTSAEFPSVSSLTLTDAQFSGSGLVTLPTAGTTTVSGAVSARALAITGGEVAGTGTLTLTGPDSFWSGGSITETTVRVANGATFTLNGGTKYFGDASLNIEAGGMVNWTSGDIQTYSNYGYENSFRSVTNAGTFDIQGDLNWTRQDFSAGPDYSVPFTITSTGTLLKSAGTGTAKLGDTVQVAGSTYRSAIDLTNNGLVDVQSGTLQLLSSFLSGGNVAATHSAGEFRASSPTSVIEFYAGTPGLVDGARLTGSGTNLLSGALLHINGTTPTASNLVFTGAANTVYPASVGVLLGGGTLTITGADSQWQGGSLSNATLRVADDARLTMNGSTKYFGDSILAIDSDGAVNWTSGDIQTFSNSYSYNNRAVDNAGVFSIQGDLAWTRYSQSATGGDYAVPFLNTGIIEKTAGTGTASLGGSVVISGTTVRNTVDLTNKGLVDVQSGTLELVSSSSYTNDGTIKIDGSATLRIPATFTHADTGLLDGSGTLDLAGNTFTNLGTISPGGNGTVGTLSINGNVDLKDGTLAVDLGGSGAGQSDLLAVTGNVGIAGILDADVLPGFTPVNGEAVSIITGTRLGATTFATTDLPAGFIAGYDLAAGEAARLIYSPSSPTGNSWVFTNAGGGLDWATANNWSGGVLPGVLDTAVLSSGFAVQHSTGDNTIFGLTINNANSLAISGGSLTVTGTTNLDGALTVAGGTANFSGPLQGSSGAVTVQGGSLTLNGASEIGSFELSAGMAIIGSSASISAYTQTGGSLTGSGSVTVTQDFHRTDGSLGSALTGVSLTQASGNLTPGELSVNGPVTLTTLSGNLSINDLLTASDRVTLQASGDINLGSGASISSAASGDAIIVAAGRNFSNFAGSNALSAVYGRRLIYSSDPALDNRGGLSYDFKHYSQTYSGTAYAGPGLGNGFLYSTSPTITPGLTGTITKTYDGTVDAVLTAANFTTSGAIDNDVIALNPLIGTYNSKDVVQANSVWVDGLSIASSTNSTGNVPVYGYQLSLNSVSGSGSITAKSLSISGSSAQGRSYDGTTNASIDLGTLTGLISGEQLNVSASGSFESKNAGLRTATATYALSDGSGGGLAANYTLAPTANLSATIFPASISLSARSDSKTYDGSNSSSLTPTISSGTLFSGDSLTGLSQSFNAKDVLAASTLNVNSGYTLNDGNGGLNYSVSLVSASGSITPKALSISGSSAADKIYDGTSNASINLGTLSGLIGSETLGVTASGSFESKNAGVRTATATYALADDSSSGGLASNYVLAPTQNLSGFITRRPQSTWSGLSSGLWSDPANWDALPSAANVAAVLIPAGTAAVSYDAAAGSTQLQSLTNNQSLSLDAGSLTVGGTTSVGPGATLSLNGGGFTTAALGNAGLVNGSGALLFDGVYSESASGRLGSSFSRVEITQTSGPLSLRGVGASGPVTLITIDGPLTLNGAITAGGEINLLASGPLSLSPGASLTSPGGTLSLFGFGPLNVEGASLNASGSATGGTVQLNGPSITLSGTSVNTSGAADGGTIRIGSIVLPGSSDLPTVLPSSVSIRNSSFVADPPALGGKINVNGAAISVSGSSFNVVGSSGGSITFGSAATASLSLDALTSLLGGGGASFGLTASAIANSASTSGGALLLNGKQQLSSNPIVPVVENPLASVLEVVISQQTFDPLQSVQNKTNGVGTAPLSPLVSQPGAPTGDRLVSLKLSESFSVLDSTDAAATSQPTQKQSSPTQTSTQTRDEKKNQLKDTIAKPEVGAEASASAKPAQQVSDQQVAAQYTAGEKKTAEATAAKLGLTTEGGTDAGFNVPTPAEIQAVLRQVIEAIRQQFSP